MKHLVCDNRGAAHLRGRILPPLERRTWVREPVHQVGGWVAYRQGWRWVRDHYWFEVVNTRTGDVVYRSDAFGLSEAARECERAVGVARWAWVMDLKRKALQ